jgi:hypothetical protein
LTKPQKQEKIQITNSALLNGIFWLSMGSIKQYPATHFADMLISGFRTGGVDIAG